MFESGGFGWVLLKAALPQVAKAILQKINSQLNPTELEKILKEAIAAAKEQNDKPPYDQGLFYYCDDRQTDKFLAEVFKYSGVQEELGKPFKNEEAPDKIILRAAFQKVADNINIKLNGRGLDAWVNKFADTYFQETHTFTKYNLAYEAYLKQLKIFSEKIDFVGIQARGDDRDRPAGLETIFVIPEFQKEENKNDIFQADDLLSRNESKKMVILGDPGSGKSTLMKYYAYKMATHQYKDLKLSDETELLPILISIKELAKQPENNILLYLQKFIPLKFSLEIPDDFFSYWLKQGKAVLLLDGLDEIADEKKCTEIVQHINSFVQQEQYAQNRAIITSRPAGYKRGFLKTEEFPHYFIQPFDDSRINLFIKKWHESRFRDDTQESNRLQESLKKVLSETKHERIKLLAKNPLLLTLIALTHRYEPYHLPQRRHKLYDAAIETLLLSWERSRFDSEAEKTPLSAQLIYIKFEDLGRLMESLAYWVHSQESAEIQGSITIIGRDQLIKQLCQSIKELKKVELYQAQEEAKKFIDYIRNRSGLLNEQGQDCYAFVHKTFQEYLCAKEVNYQYRDEEDFNIVLNHIKDNLNNPHWHEVLLLLIVTQTTPNQIAKAIKAVLETELGKEDNCYYSLLFAGSCLAEDPLNLKSAKNDPSSEILKQLVDLEISNDSKINDTIRSQVFQTLCSLSQTAFAEPALNLLREKTKFKLISEARMQEYEAALAKKRGD